MLTNNKLEILSSFFPKIEKDKTTKEIEIKTGLSHETTFRLLKELAKEKYLIEKKVGKTNVYEFVFNDNIHLIYSYFVTKRIQDFKKRHNLFYKRLVEFVNEIQPVCVILFGSYAKGTEAKDSDIDILVISKNKNIDKVASAFKTKYDLAIKPVVIKSSDFKNIKKDNPPFYDDMLEYGIIIEGIDYFFKKVFKNGKRA